MLKPTASLLKQLSEATKGMKSKSDRLANQALTAKYKAMSADELQAEFDKKMAEPREPIIIDGKDIRDLTRDELLAAFASQMRDLL